MSHHDHRERTVGVPVGRALVLTGAVAVALYAMTTPVAHAVSFQVPGTNTTLDVGGYAKLDIIYNSISAGDNN